MKKGSIMTLDELEKKVMAERSLKEDALVNTQCMEYVVEGSEQNMCVIDRKKDAVLMKAPVNRTAHAQIGRYLEIPVSYYNMMLEKNPQLLATNINTWFAQKPAAQRMIRRFDGRMRAFLSNQYLKLDNDAVLYTVLPILEKLGLDAEVESCEITESRLYIKVVNKKVQAEVTPGDIVQAGVIITNSEVGLGSITVKPLVYRLVCRNGMVINDAVSRAYHKGARMKSNTDFMLFKDDTREAQARSLRLEIRDIVEDAVSQVTLDRVTHKYKMAKNMEITGDIPSLVTMTGREFDIKKDEKEGVMEHLYRRGDYTLYGLSNAITEMSQTVDDYDRASELEEVGYKVLNMSRTQWKRMNVEKEEIAIAA